MLFVLVTSSQAQQVDLDNYQSINELIKQDGDQFIDSIIDRPAEDLASQASVLKELTRVYLADAAEFEKAQNKTSEYFDKLIYQAKQEENYHRLEWSSDYIEGLLFTVLPARQRADLFLTCGLPSPTMEKEAAVLVFEAMRVVQYALNDWQEMKETLPKKEDFDQQLLISGQWDDLQEIGNRNLPFFRAWCSLYLSLIKDGSIDESKHLLKQAIEDISGLLEDSNRMDIKFVAQIQILKGQLLLQMDKPLDGLVAFKKASNLEVADQTKFVSRLLQSKALHKAGRSDQAGLVIDELSDNAVAWSGPVNMILITDCRAQMLRDAAESVTDSKKKQLLISKSFQIYQELLDDQKISLWRENVEAFLFSRFASQLTDDVDPALLSPMVVLAKAISLRESGQILLNDDKQAAMAQLDQSIDLLQEILKRDGLGRSFRAKALFNLGAAELLIDQTDSAVQTFKILGNDYSDMQLGEKGISIAVLQADKLYSQSTGNVQTSRNAIRLYEEVLKILLDKYWMTDLAKQRTYSYAAVLRESGRYEQAVKAYDNVPDDHIYYTEALYEHVTCLTRMRAEAKINSKAYLTEEIDAAVDKFMNQADMELTDDIPDQRRMRIVRYKAFAVITKARIMLESNRPKKTIELIQGIEDKYKNVDSLAEQATGLRIDAYYKLGQYDKVEENIYKLMDIDLTLGGPFALKMFNSLFLKLEIEYKEQGQVKNRKLGYIVYDLAGSSLVWIKSETNQLNKRKPILIMAAKSLLYGGSYEQAIAEFEKLHALDKNNFDVIEGLAESYFHDEQYLKASKHYNTIINYIVSNKLTKEHSYWNAQARLYTMMDKAGAKPYKIRNGIKRLSSYDINLGGEPYASVLKALLKKYSLQ